MSSRISCNKCSFSEEHNILDPEDLDIIEDPKVYCLVKGKDVLRTYKCKEYIPIMDRRKYQDLPEKLKT